MGNPHICPVWFAYTFDTPLRALFHKPERILAPYVRHGMSVADIGCGLGYFALGLAAMVGDEGRVLAVDIQSGMLTRLKKLAMRAGLAHRIETRQCTAESANLDAALDFALAFWMVHETPVVERFLGQIHTALKPGGVLLITEPKLHVTAAEFDQELDAAKAAGCSLEARPAIAFSRSAVLKKAAPAATEH